MPRILISAGIAVALLTPALASAAFDDVSLATDTVLSVGGITLIVAGSTASVESITVGATNFSFALQSGSSIRVLAPSGNILVADSSDDRTTSACNGVESFMTYTGTSAHTVTITPSAELCTGAESGGGGGGGGSRRTTTTTPVVAATGSGLTSVQIKSILDVLASFGTDSATMAKVQAALSGNLAPGSVTSTAVHIFQSDLTTGSVGSAVKALQQFLNGHGYTVSSSGPGSAGNETTTFGAATKAALMKYQQAKGITPAAGYLGPKTRAAINAEK